MANLNQSQYGYNWNNNTTAVPNPYPYNNLISHTPYENYMGNLNQQNNQFLKCRPVSSREQAVAFQIDLDGSLWVFPNVANGKIYTKQINNDGTATFNTYTLSQDEIPYDSQQYVTKNEFNKVIQTIMAAIQPHTPQTESVTNQTQTHFAKEKLSF